jgi:hypothetical protein
MAAGGQTPRFFLVLLFFVIFFIIAEKKWQAMRMNGKNIIVILLKVCKFLNQLNPFVSYGRVTV